MIIMNITSPLAKMLNQGERKALISFEMGIGLGHSWGEVIFLTCH